MRTRLFAGRGTFSAAEITDSGRATLSDDVMGEKIVTPSELFLAKLRGWECPSLFRIPMDISDSPLSDAVYRAQGEAGRPVGEGTHIAPHQMRIIYCNCSLSEYRKRRVSVFRFEGFANVWDAQRRCVAKKRRATYIANYSKSGAPWRNTLIIGMDAEGVIFRLRNQASAEDFLLRINRAH